MSKMKTKFYESKPIIWKHVTKIVSLAKAASGAKNEARALPEPRLTRFPRLFLLSFCLLLCVEKAVPLLRDCAVGKNAAELRDGAHGIAEYLAEFARVEQKIPAGRLQEHHPPQAGFLVAVIGDLPLGGNSRGGKEHGVRMEAADHFFRKPPGVCLRGGRQKPCLLYTSPSPRD